ncbi:MAG: hypothetical protein ACXVH1_30325 [Solirubrobacteraceae bacterium]
MLGVVSLYLALVAFNALAAAVLLTPGVLRRELGHGVGFGDYAALVLLVSSLATLGGALGAALENHRAVRAAAYGRLRPPRRRARARRGPPRMTCPASPSSSSRAIAALLGALGRLAALSESPAVVVDNGSRETPSRP